jgi:diadenosine tetraphosphatase ApaH/serine/threonine PP2A family protein phosphatase
MTSRISETGSPLPKTEHAELHLSQLQKRLLIVSDVHGCLDEVEKLLAKVNYSPNTTSVIFVGDLVVKGPKSKEVIRFLMKQKRMLSVRGNHEDNALLAHYHPTTSKYAKGEGYAFVKDLTKDEIDFIQQLPISISIPELQLLVVHAGLDPTKRGLPVHNHSFSDLIRIRCVKEDGTTTKDNPNDSGSKKLWGPQYIGPPFVVFGHDAKRKLQVHPWARGLDTGCCYGGSLTGLLIQDTRDVQNWMKNMQIVSVQAARVYSNPASDD